VGTQSNIPARRKLSYQPDWWLSFLCATQTTTEREEEQQEETKHSIHPNA